MMRRKATVAVSPQVQCAVPSCGVALDGGCPDTTNTVLVRAGEPLGAPRVSRRAVAASFPGPVYCTSAVDSTSTVP